MAVSIWEGSKAQDLIDAVSDISQNDGIPENVKAAMLNCFQNVAWANGNGQSYYNALYNALYGQEESWDYEWYASSGENPPDMTGYSFDFTADPGALKVVRPNLTKTFETSDFEAVIVCKIPLHAQDGQPKFSIDAYTNDTDNFNITFAFNNVTSNTGDQNKVCFMTNWDSSGKETTSYDQTVYREYHLVYQNGTLNIYFDNVLVKSVVKLDSNKHVSASAFKIVSGSSTTVDDIYFKSIKLRQL